MIRVYADMRMGDDVRWVYGDPRRSLMRVPDTALNCVVFLCVKDAQGQFHYGGTAFLVAWPQTRFPGDNFNYLVTARHNIEKARQGYGNLYIRANRTNGEAAMIDTEGAVWTYSENPASDVAVLGVGGFDNPMDLSSIAPSMTLSDQVAADRGFGIGDEIFSVGLFARHWGKTRNLPIVRSGIVAAMPGEPLEDPNSGVEYDAYLAEIRSIGGLSGSPVFVFFGMDRILEGQAKRYQSTSIYLIGLIRGHWPKGELWLSDFGEIDETDTINTGIAIVTPIADALTVIEEDPKLKDERKEAEEQRVKQNAPVEDSGLASGESEYDRFEGLARDLVNRPKPKPDGDKS